MNQTVSNASNSSRVVCAAEDREAGYNLRAAFPDFPEVLQVWQKATAAIRESMLSDADIAYGPGDLQRFDFYRAAGENRPLLIFIHGGYWQSGDKSDIGFIAAAYVRAGISVAVMNYSLAPQVRIAQMIEETDAMLACVERMAAQLDIDAQRISLMGHSAGGHLAAFIAARRAEAPLHAVFAVSGVFDLAPLVTTSLNKALSMDAESAEQLSPVLLEGPDKTRVHTIVGQHETTQFHRQAAVIARCWPQVIAHHVVPDTHHYTVLMPLADESTPVCQAVIAEILR